MNANTTRNTRHTLPTLVLLLGTLPWLAACGGQKDHVDNAAAGTTAAGDALGAKASKIGREVREKMANENINLDSDESGVPDATISPAGDLLIDGKPVAINDEQRALLIKYRTHVTEVAASGAEIGVESAKVATQAVGTAIASIFSGESSDDIGDRIEADVEKKIRGTVQRLCRQLPPLLETQQALAASLPEFKPYADMDGSDIKDCMDNAVADAGETGTEVGSEADAASEAEAVTNQ